MGVMRKYCGTSIFFLKKTAILFQSQPNKQQNTSPKTEPAVRRSSTPQQRPNNNSKNKAPGQHSHTTAQNNIRPQHKEQPQHKRKQQQTTKTKEKARQPP